MPLDYSQYEPHWVKEFKRCEHWIEDALEYSHGTHNIQDIFEERGNHEGEQEILDMIDGLTTIRQITYERERLLGIEMPKTQLRELYLWDEEKDMRIGKHQYDLGF